MAPDVSDSAESCAEITSYERQACEDLGGADHRHCCLGAVSKVVWDEHFDQVKGGVPTKEESCEESMLDVSMSDPWLGNHDLAEEDFKQWFLDAQRETPASGELRDRQPTDATWVSWSSLNWLSEEFQGACSLIMESAADLSLSVRRPSQSFPAE
mmetsp:Transcript_3885/g.10760  ORF Transcript_3885/g.10760 Transcript_3885/m.10760 type:complete len:155 (-) Transcript_3885:255-719(-)|eukprot:CAMPEP_0194482538 /NCGR_PEP_ID=MMETSP0253-20130528/4441_1 /TAXON_ID=2966 /ORGANISM="Noctiluca scintillans" /LENGTH=154 /DNA_ID=CAMNT_0039322079 /DNA_START=82 /DNA_END=546 /DNA_ORIENTATION=+